jgi:hypothetical protein
MLLTGLGLIRSTVDDCLGDAGSWNLSDMSALQSNDLQFNMVRVASNQI